MYDAMGLPRAQISSPNYPDIVCFLHRYKIAPHTYLCQLAPSLLWQEPKSVEMNFGVLMVFVFFG